MEHHFTYAGALAASEKVRWRVEDLIGGDKQLDFSRPFLPESLARTQPLEFLGADDKLLLNHIRGHDYLYIFGLVEEFILPFVLDHARTQLQGDDYRVRALLEFAGEEAKHIQLFKNFRSEFEKGFGKRCEAIGPAAEIARAVLAHHPLGVALVILQIEWMTQQHYVESIRDDQQLDPQFKSLLRHHWMEEAQHAKLDTLMVEALARVGSGDVDTAIDDYMKIGALLDGGLQKQVELDLASFEAARGAMLSAAQRDAFLSVQGQATRWTFLGSGMSHPNFQATLGALRPAALARVEEMIPTFS